MPLTDFDIRVTPSAEGVGVLSWVGAPASGTLIGAIVRITDAALLEGGLRRVEATVTATDPTGRRAVLRAGFRLEGVRRQAGPLVAGGYADLMTFGRLRGDRVDGPHGYSGVMNSALPRKRLIAHVLMRDPGGRVLLCETQFKTDWELPGGIVEPGETPRTGAVREVAEELGLDLPVGRLLVVDWLPPYLGWEDAIEMIFDGGLVEEPELAEMTLQPSEIRSVRLCTLAEAAVLVTPIAFRRIALASALGPDETAYTEDGRR